MTERIPHIYSYTSAGNTGRTVQVHPMCVAMAASSHSTQRDWYWQFERSLLAREFTCPKCGSHMFGTSHCLSPFPEWIGHCHGNEQWSCDFTWNRKTQDHEVMKASPAAVESPVISPEPAQALVEFYGETQDTITEWANATFGPADSNIRIAARANEEMAELLRALSADDDNPKAAEEIADVVIVLYRVASRLGYDLHELIDKKMEINRGREWKLDNTGHGYHVRDKSVTPTETPTATPSAAVGADEPGAGDEKEWCDGAKEFCERQVESETVPRAEYDRVVKLNHHLREVAVMAIVERVPSDSKPSNSINPESEDTPPHNPVMGPVVGTATVKHQTSCPAATAPTVPPEVGKRYVCGNGEVTDAMTLDGGPAYPFMARTDHVLRSWRGDGRHDESKISEYDLIAEYHEPEPSPPAESPDDWVTQDRVPARPGIDQRAYLYGTNALSDWEDSECVKWHDMPMHGQSNNCGGIFQLRCRRKDLPTMPVVNNSVERGKLPPVDASKLPSIPQKVLDDRSEWREQAAAWSELFGWCCRNGFDCADNRYNGLNGLGTLAQWILDLKSAAKPNNQNATPPVVPKTRTVTLREYTTDGEVYWTTNPNVRTTGRTCECEVPE